MKYIINMDDCYMGLEKEKNKDGSFNAQLGSYSELSDNPKIDINSIEFDGGTWIEETEYFKEYLNSEIEKYEKKYKTEVVEIALCGSLSFWNGTCIGGKIVTTENILNSSCEKVRVFIDDNKDLNIELVHHDGTHIMGIYFLTENKLKNNPYSKDDPNFFEYLYTHSSPLKFSKNGYYGLMSFIERKGDVDFYKEGETMFYQIDRLNPGKKFKVYNGNMRYKKIKQVNNYLIKFNTNGIHGFSICSLDSKAIFEDNIWALDEAIKIAKKM